MNKISFLHRLTPVRRRAALVVLAVTAATAASTPTSAHAGTYVMHSCQPPGVNVPELTRGPWTNQSGNPSNQPIDACNGANAADPFFGFTNLSNQMSPNTSDAWGLQVPTTGPKSAIGIVRVKSHVQTSLAGTGAAAHGLNLNPAISEAPGGDDRATGYTSATLSPAATSFLLGVYCDNGGAGAGCSLANYGVMKIRGTTTTLSEDVLPIAAIDGGSLLGSGAQKGTRSVSWSAQDQESGIEKVEVLLDGAVAASVSQARDLTKPVAQQSGDCTYISWNACPPNQSGTFNIDTTRVPDGAYELSLRAIDAAGNGKTVAASRPVVIDNVVDQPAPVGPTPIVVPQPGADAKAGAVVTINGTNGSAAATLRATFASSRRGVVKSAYGRRVLVTGELRAPGGAPIVGARLSVMQQDKMLGARMAPAGEVVTDRRGKFRYVTTARRSGTLRFGYRTRLQDTDFSETTDISLGVTPKVTFSTDRTSLRNGQTVRFRGSIPGAPNVRKVVELQVKKGRGWMTFRSTRLRSGRFGERYRFTRTRGRVTYVFRARVRQEVGFPFLTGVSKQARVTVRG